MSFGKPYQKASGKTVHRGSRKAKPSATVGYLNPKRYQESKGTPMSDVVDLIRSIEKGLAPDLTQALRDLDSYVNSDGELHVTRAQYARLRALSIELECFTTMIKPLPSLRTVKVVIV